MDDFLHNLRSGKLKHPDRGRRDYSEYKGPQRRQGTERRKPDYYAKVTAENFALVKDSLDLLAENQKRIANVMAAREKTESRIADALESIAKTMKHHCDIQDLLVQEGELADPQPATPTQETPVPIKRVKRAGNGPDAGAGNSKLRAEDKPGVLDIIATMRTEGNSWEKIARHMDERNIPTVSGKGKWRGTAIKKFWETNTTDAGS